MKVYLVRHGESTANVNGIFSGHMDVELTANGKKQAASTSIVLKNCDFDRVYSSDLKRAVQTAEIVVASRYNIIKSPLLREMSFGIFEGKSMKQLKEESTAEFLEWSVDFENNKAPGGESIMSSGERVVNFYKEIIDDAIRLGLENIILFSHMGPIKAILASEICGGLDHHGKYHVDNCRISVIEYGKGGESVLLCMNNDCITKGKDI